MKLTYWYCKDKKEVFIPVKLTGIHMMFVLTDGIGLMLFNKSKTPFMSLNDAIKWHKKELQYSTQKEFKQKLIQQMIDKNNEILTKHKDEK